MSCAIIDRPVTAPASSSDGETVISTSTRLPSLRRQIDSQRSVGPPASRRPNLSGGIRPVVPSTAKDLPIKSSGVYPNKCWAPAFQLVTRPPVVDPKMASPEFSTIVDSSRCARSDLMRSVLSTATMPIPMISPSTLTG